jgi:hypothetical protein
VEGDEEENDGEDDEDDDDDDGGGGDDDDGGDDDMQGRGPLVVDVESCVGHVVEEGVGAEDHPSGRHLHERAVRGGEG